MSDTDPAPGPGLADNGPRAAASDWTAGGLGVAITAARRIYPVPARAAQALAAAGILLGVLGDGLLRGPDPPGLNLTLWIAAVALAGLWLHGRSGIPIGGGRAAWLGVGVLFATGLAWRDAIPLRLLGLASATLAFALAAYRPAAAWVRRSGIVRYAVALALGSLHAWTASALALLDAIQSRPWGDVREGNGRRPMAVVRGLALAVPLLVIFGALLMSADAVFAGLVERIVRVDFGRIAGHVFLFAIAAWISTGYLRGLLTGTDPARVFGTVDQPHAAGDADQAPRAPAWLTLGTTEIATTLAAVDVLFLVFVVIQFRYLFGGDTLVQVTPNLTYADYARRGFFELVVAAALVVPVLLAADWVRRRENRRADTTFRALAGVQVALVLAMAASAFERLRLYYASYGLTDSRVYAMVLLGWVAAMLCWLAATVLRGRRDRFAYGALTSGFAVVALLFVVDPDALVARVNVARIAATPDGAARFDAVHASSLSGDAVPALVGALPSLPADSQCRIARSLLRRWEPDQPAPRRNWNWAASRARETVRANADALDAMVAACP